MATRIHVNMANPGIIRTENQVPAYRYPQPLAIRLRLNKPDLPQTAVVSVAVAGIVTCF